MRHAAPALLLFLAACGRGGEQPQDLNSLDRELTDANSAGNRRDPALAQALHDQIMVDPTLSQQSNANAIKPAPRLESPAVPPELPARDPVDARTLHHAPAAAGACPECKAKAQSYTLGALAARQPATAGCAGAVAYAAGWANRLPADLPLYPGADVIEAAGNNIGACRLRVVSFTTGAAPAKLIDYYYTQATHAGYSAEHRRDGAMQVLGGTRGNDALVVYATPRQNGGAEVNLISNAGR